MAFVFKKATKTKARLRMALCGPSGTGKTYTALKVGTILAEGKPILLIDTERGSAAKYSSGKPFDFDTFSEFDQHTGYDPRILVEMLNQAASQYAVVIIDSLSHFWFGTGGELDQVDRAAKRSSSGNSFAAWREVTPMHNRLIETLLTSPAHIICTLRTKTEWVIEENDRGKKIPVKKGMAPIMKDGIEYEFDVCGDLDQQNTLVITKSRCPALSGAVIQRPGADVAGTLAEWLTDGVEGEEKRTAPPDAEPINPDIKGSKEAAQEVAQQRIAEEGEKLRKTKADKTPLTADGIKRLQAFAAIKQELFIATGNNDAYYRILGAAGYESSKDIKDRDSAKTVYYQLGEALKEIRLAKQEKETTVA